MDREKLSQLESLLFALAKPISLENISNILALSPEKTKELLAKIEEKYNQEDSGIYLTTNNNKVQFVTNPKNGKFLRDYFKEELEGELSKPSLEALTIIAYRQPISKEELEQIRGVNCSLILRNLLIRGYIEAYEDKNSLTTNYGVTMEFLRHLGLTSVSQLPDFEKLNSDENLHKLLEENIDKDGEKSL